MELQSVRRTTWHELDEALQQEIFTCLQQSGHVAVLGPRRSAKSLLVEEIEAQAQKLPSPPRVACLTWDQFSACDPACFLDIFARALVVASPAYDPQTPLVSLLLQALRVAVAEASSVWLFFQDIIGFPKRIVRQVLQALTACHQEDDLRGRVATLITGSAEVLPLIYGSESLYDQAHVFVLTGMSYEFAYNFVARQRQFVSRQFDAPTAPGTGGEEQAHPRREHEITPEAFAYLYKQTGGQAHLVQELLVGVARHPFLSGLTSLQRPWQLEDIQRYIETFSKSDLPYDHILRATLRETESNADYTTLLLHVLNGTLIEPFSNSQPHALEVNGLLKRAPDGTPIFAAPLLKEFVQHIWSGRRIGDIYAFQGRWEEAWQQYNHAPGDISERPISGSPRQRLRETLISWQRYMHMHRRVSDVTRHFLYGASYLLGFDRSGFYGSTPPVWLYAQHEVLDTSLLPPCPVNAISIISKQPNGTTLRYRLDAERMRVWCGPLLKSSSVEVSDPILYLERVGEGRELDATDQDCLTQALIAFWEAYEAAQEIEYREQIGKLREHFSEVQNKVTEIVSNEMLEDVVNMQNVLEAATRSLVNIAGYYRVLICLVNTDRSRIQAVATYCRETAARFNFETNYTLPPLGSRPASEDLATMDVQQWVVVEKRTVRIPDAHSSIQRNPTVNFKEVQLSRAK